MVAALVLVSAFLILGMRRGALVPGRMQSLAELSYEFVDGLISDTVGAEGRRYFPLVFTLFMFILFGNVPGMLPYSFTSTSHIIVTFALALLVLVGVTTLDIAQHGPHFFSSFAPPAAHPAVLPPLTPPRVTPY